MNSSLQEYLPSVMKFLTRKLIFKNKFKYRFSNRKSDFGFQTKNRISVFKPKTGFPVFD